MHIMSDERYNRLMAMQAYLEDPAPLPMRDEEDTDLRAARACRKVKGLQGA